MSSKDIIGGWGSIDAAGNYTKPTFEMPENTDIDIEDMFTPEDEAAYELYVTKHPEVSREEYAMNVLNARYLHDNELMKKIEAASKAKADVNWDKSNIAGFTDNEGGLE